MSRAAHSKHKVEVLAHSLRSQPIRRDPVVGDLRLVASPMRYKVQIWQHHAAAGFQYLTGWQDTRDRFPRTRRQYVDLEYQCAVAMFWRRCWEQWMVREAKAWPSQDGRITQICNLDTPHLKNIIAKVERADNWRRRFLPTLKEELDRRAHNNRR